MDLSNEYFFLPKKTIESLVDTSDKLTFTGSIDISEFQGEFGAQIISEGLTGEKAMYIGLQIPSRTLPSIKELLLPFIPRYV